VQDTPGGFIARALGSIPFVSIGQWSYSLYLWHWPIMVGLRWTVGLDHIWTQIAALLLTLAAGLASYRLIETPFRHNFRGASRSLIIVGISAVTVVTAVSTWTESRLTRRITLSVTGNHDDWYADAKPIRLPSTSSGCPVEMDRYTFLSANVTHWMPKPCLTTKAARLIVLGDSHALAIAPALARLSSELHIEVIDYSKTFCGFLTLRSPLSSTTECKAFGKGLIQHLRRQIRPGDIILLESLRVQRFIDQDGTAPLLSDADLANRVAATSEAIAVLKSFSRAGAKIIFPLPLPVLPSPPFRCSDWFNRNNPACVGGLSLSRKAENELRASASTQIKAIASAVPGVTVWDPLPRVCPDQICAAYLHGRPVFFDGDHLSGYGNQILFPDLKKVISDVDAKRSD
jgi:hypothetical protein